ncbi:MAG: hypothetical protein Q8R76_08350 [Candidatus Omnitrophota bacterium]|nr:hypothetical protein [Candidatus Omnitrophota bacterium]
MITFVIFHVDNTGKRKKKGGDPRRMMYLLFRSAELHHPHCRKVVISDLRTDLSYLAPDIEIKRYDVDPTQIALSRWNSRNQFLADQDFSSHFVLLDYDILVNANLLPLFDQPFDVALTYRHRTEADKRPKLKINGGILFLKANRKAASMSFLNRVFTTYKEKFISRPDWWGGQYSMNEVVGHANVPESGTRTVKTGDSTILLLPCDQYNFSPSNRYRSIAAEFQTQKILHFKARCRRLMNLYWDIYFTRRITKNPGVALQSLLKRLHLLWLIIYERAFPKRSIKS